MAYLALLLIALLAVLAYVPGLPSDVAGVPTEPVAAATRSVVGRAKDVANHWAEQLRERGMAFFRGQLHDIVEESVR